jgi:two-component system cell cycle response regulator DivK
MTKKARILIVEDNEKNMKLMADVLTYHGYEIVQANSGEEGLKAAFDYPPDLVLMDIQLPGMNGIEALSRIRADPRTQRVKVIAVTASVMTHDRRHLLDCGFDDYQPKPIELKDFVERVKGFADQTIDDDEADND